ncbi:MAG: chemotaxis protein CheW [Desulfobacteraceae bacterium]|nr:chemotaxis protein CheW [Desulfobacteraceae bacterium]
MKKTKKKTLSSKCDSKLSACVEPELKELIADIENEIKTAQHLDPNNTVDFEEGQNRVDIGRHICIELGVKQLAIPLAAVLEAGEHLRVQPLPLLPDWITGISNIRGEIISVVNLNLFFDTKSAPPRTPHMPRLPVDTKPYLIVHNDDMKIAITVDRILATRPLYSLTTKESKEEVQKKDMLSKYFSGQAFYEEENVQKEIFLFALDKFLSSSNLHDFSTA